MSISVDANATVSDENIICIMYECSLQQHIYSKWKDTENTGMVLHKDHTVEDHF